MLTKRELQVIIICLKFVAETNIATNEEIELLAKLERLLKEME